MVKWRQMSDGPFLNEDSFDVASRMVGVIVGRKEVKEFCEIVLSEQLVEMPSENDEYISGIREVCEFQFWSKKDTIPAEPGSFHAPVVQDLLEQYKQLLVAPKIDP
ncbi:hypothetical protein WUBG_05989 [Wuchereria bancrofti]|uniref:Uncharacterized protein n=1 Tax=Wuchereria bancrofti TaxID=6293 RepID=J9EKY1_WUCBA|nr:hypothetical protein WUBG_05989 [Wuchereria bancrofti]VDM11720.1 unnamed protein product [Wuchereria bancrofti]